MRDQLKSNPELDAALNSATTASEIREKMLNTLAKQGTIIRSPLDEFDTRLIRRPSEPGVPPPANGFKFEREFRYHPESGRRALILRADSIEELNKLQSLMEKTV